MQKTNKKNSLLIIGYPQLELDMEQQTGSK